MALYRTSKKKPIRKRHSYIEDENGNLIQVEAIRKKRKTTLTRPHRIGIRVVDKLGIRWEDEKRFGRYSIDIYLPDYNIALECDGEYFHQLPGVPEKDARRDRELFLKYGIVTVRYTDTEINENHHKVEKKLSKVVANIDKVREMFRKKYSDTNNE